MTEGNGSAPGEMTPLISVPKRMESGSALFQPILCCNGMPTLPKRAFERVWQVHTHTHEIAGYVQPGFRCPPFSAERLLHSQRGRKKSVLPDKPTSPPGNPDQLSTSSTVRAPVRLISVSFISAVLWVTTPVSLVDQRRWLPAPGELNPPRN